MDLPFAIVAAKKQEATSSTDFSSAGGEAFSDRLMALLRIQTH